MPNCLFGLYSANFPIGNADLRIPGSTRLHNTVHRSLVSHLISRLLRVHMTPPYYILCIYTVRRDKGHPWVTHGSHRAPTRQHHTPCGAGMVLPWVTRFYGGCCKNPCITGLHRTRHVPETTSVTIYCHPCHLSPAPPLTCAAVRCLSRRLSRALPLALCRAAVVRAVCCAARRPCHVSRHPSPAPLSHGASPATRRATACHAAARCSHRLAIVSCRRRSRSPRGEE